MKKEKDTIKKEELKKEAETQEEIKEEQEVHTEESTVSIEDLQEQLEQCREQMLRHQADLENYKKRLLREKEDAVLYSNTKLIEDILQFLDNMERAISAAKNGGDVKSLTDGVEMTQSQLLSALEKNWGLKRIDSVGKEFDPSLHEACMAVVDEKLDFETVLEEFQTGYTLHDRVLRPAKVKIGKPE